MKGAPMALASQHGVPGDRDQLPVCEVEHARGRRRPWRAPGPAARRCCPAKRVHQLLDELRRTHLDPADDPQVGPFQFALQSCPWRRTPPRAPTDSTYARSAISRARCTFCSTSSTVTPSDAAPGSTRRSGPRRWGRGRAMVHRAGASAAATSAPVRSRAVAALHPTACPPAAWPVPRGSGTGPAIGGVGLQLVSIGPGDAPDRQVLVRRSAWGRRDDPPGPARPHGARTASGTSPDRGLPSKLAEPCCGFSAPAMARSSVVLPAPFGPSVATISPVKTSSETSRIATTAP